MNTDEQFDETVGRQALKRRLTPDDAAAAVAYLASDMAAAAPARPAGWACVAAAVDDAADGIAPTARE